MHDDSYPEEWGYQRPPQQGNDQATTHDPASLKSGLANYGHGDDREPEFPPDWARR
ncbi:hypothetical protein PR370_07360 [Mycobacterium marinum]|uniref:hypothetical protein n=1 Tax=Mycobacterium marinum TaxID=1781 RepID=UPI000EDC1679|nr:hypothetical protein [Mycobacterium marinum]MDC8980978.1 hypothetical protein [Mycobacterium marinum]MDC8999288.1 hypothetical protein [Mycobacterium marinum]MDC9009859.1 hypothetical protein [Mycobacterium marinum]RFZ49348.1 hypothetical protein MSS2_04245 [Mycobacterium marinum]